MSSMAKVETSRWSGNSECQFAAKCVFEKDGSCPVIRILADTDEFPEAKAVGLKPERVPALWYGGNPDDEDMMRMELCASAINKSRIIDGVRLLWPQLFTDDAAELEALREADALARGDIDDPDQVKTELGLQMLDALTNSELSPWAPTHKLTITDGVLEPIPVYDLEK